MHGILLDADYVIALAFDNESTYPKALKISRDIKNIPQAILIPVLYEIATVTSRKFGHDLACRLTKSICELDIERIAVDNLETKILELFYSQRKKSTSMFDCANLVAAKHYGFKIASFDNFYPKDILL